MSLPLVLLPGMMCDARLFAPQIAALSGRHAVHCAPISGHDSMGALAAEVLAHAPPRFALAGLSMGGIVAMEVVRQAAERVERLALLDTNPRAEMPDVRAAREPQIAAVRAGRLKEIMRDELKPNYLVESPKKPAILDLCMDMAMAMGPEVFIRQSRALATRPDQTETLAAWHGPALILMGAEDRLCPRDRHDQMHALMPQSTLVIVEKAGHLPTLEQPERTTAALLRWLEDT